VHEEMFKFTIRKLYVLPYAPFMFVAYVASLGNSQITTPQIRPESVTP